jgi:hypothetical protein
VVVGVVCLGVLHGTVGRQPVAVAGIPASDRRQPSAVRPSFPRRLLPQRLAGSTR